MVVCADAMDGIRRFCPENAIDCCVTSPPYFNLRDYGVDGQIGNESAPEDYVSRLVEVFREVRRVLRDDGTLWVIIGDSYAGSGKGGNPIGREGKQDTNKGTLTIKGKKTPTFDGLKPKDLIGIPWMLAFALRADGWYLRQDIIWHKPNAMPESVRDRCTRAHEYIFMFTKSPRYFYDNEAVAEKAVNGDPRPPRGSKGALTENLGRRKQDGHGRRHAGFNERYHSNEHAPVTTRNRRSVWTVTTKPLKEAHFATFPPDLIEPCILASSRPGGIVLDPFCGSGTVGLLAERHGREFIGIDINREYCELAERRINKS
ncbi:methyltransferase [Clostridia bacterium]|nr:methyltransferase [Clostridia bacterium]